MNTAALTAVWVAGSNSSSGEHAGGVGVVTKAAHLRAQAAHDLGASVGVGRPVRPHVYRLSGPNRADVGVVAGGQFVLQLAEADVVDGGRLHLEQLGEHVTQTAQLAQLRRAVAGHSNGFNVPPASRPNVPSGRATIDPGLRPDTSTSPGVSRPHRRRRRGGDRVVAVATGGRGDRFGGQHGTEAGRVQHAGDPQVVGPVGAAQRGVAEDQLGVVDEPLVDRHRPVGGVQHGGAPPRPGVGRRRPGRRRRSTTRSVTTSVPATWRWVEPGSRTAVTKSARPADRRPGLRVAGVHRVPRREHGDHAARPSEVEGFDDEVVVDRLTGRVVAAVVTRRPGRTFSGADGVPNASNEAIRVAHRCASRPSSVVLARTRSAEPSDRYGPRRHRVDVAAPEQYASLQADLSLGIDGTRRAVAVTQIEQSAEARVECSSESRSLTSRKAVALTFMMRLLRTTTTAPTSGMHVADDTYPTCSPSCPTAHGYG